MNVGFVYVVYLLCSFGWFCVRVRVVDCVGLLFVFALFLLVLIVWFVLDLDFVTRFVLMLDCWVLIVWFVPLYVVTLLNCLDCICVCYVWFVYCVVCFAALHVYCGWFMLWVYCGFGGFCYDLGIVLFGYLF